MGTNKTIHDYITELNSNEEWNLGELIDNKCDYYTTETLNDINCKEGNLKVLQLNIHSLHAKKNQLKELINNFKIAGHEIDVILLCETFMNELNKNKNKIRGYTLKEYAYREKTKCGGVAIYIKSNIKAIARTDLKLFIEGRLETCFIELITPDKKKNIIIGEMYRVPGTNEKQFLNDYEYILNKLKTENKEIIIGTDQNMDF